MNLLNRHLSSSKSKSVRRRHDIGCSPSHLLTNHNKRKSREDDTGPSSLKSENCGAESKTEEISKKHEDLPRSAKFVAKKNNSVVGDVPSKAQKLALKRKLKVKQSRQRTKCFRPETLRLRKRCSLLEDTVAELKKRIERLDEKCIVVPAETDRNVAEDTGDRGLTIHSSEKSEDSSCNTEALPEKHYEEVSFVETAANGVEGAHLPQSLTTLLLEKTNDYLCNTNTRLSEQHSEKVATASTETAGNGTEVVCNANLTMYSNVERIDCFSNTDAELPEDHSEKVALVESVEKVAEDGNFIDLSLATIEISSDDLHTSEEPLEQFSEEGCSRYSAQDPASKDLQNCFSDPTKATDDVFLIILNEELVKARVEQPLEMEQVQVTTHQPDCNDQLNACQRNGQASSSAGCSERRENDDEGRITCSAKKKKENSDSVPKKVHVREVLMRDTPPYCCNICDESFSCKSNWTRHQQKHILKPFLCPKCKKPFAKKTYLIRHQATHTEMKPYKCGICDTGFKHKHTKLKHERYKHTEVACFKCAVCGKMFNYKISIIRHLREHSDQKPFRCQPCGTRFAQKSHLVKHKMTHSKERKFKCRICNQLFKYQSSKTRHERLHEEGPRYECALCGKKYPRKNSLARHISSNCRRIQTHHERTREIANVAHSETSSNVTKDDRDLLTVSSSKNSNSSLYNTETRPQKFFEEETAVNGVEGAHLPQSLTTLLLEKSNDDPCTTNTRLSEQHSEKVATASTEIVGNGTEVVCNANLTMYSNVECINSLSNTDAERSEDHSEKVAIVESVEKVAEAGNFIDLSMATIEILSDYLHTSEEPLEQFSEEGCNRYSAQGSLVEFIEQFTEDYITAKASTLPPEISGDGPHNSEEEFDNFFDEVALVETAHDIAEDARNTNLSIFSQEEKLMNDSHDTNTAPEQYSEEVTPIETSAHTHVNENENTFNTNAIVLVPRLENPDNSLHNADAQPAQFFGDDPPSKDSRNCFSDPTKAADDNMLLDILDDDEVVSGISVSPQVNGVLRKSDNTAASSNNEQFDEVHVDQTLRLKLVRVTTQQPNCNDELNLRQRNWQVSSSAGCSKHRKNNGGGRITCSEKKKKELPNLPTTMQTSDTVHKNVPGVLMRDSPPYCCDICDESFSHKSHWTRHQRKHSEKRPYKCAFCDTRFKHNYSKLHHERYKHTKVACFECAICGKTFNHKISLIRHLQIHSGEKPFRCENCGTRFSRKDCLVSHQKMHSKEKNFKCRICDKLFKHQHQKTAHERLHEEGSRFECALCGKKYKQKHGLAYHISYNCRTSRKIVSKLFHSNGR